jgi:hypothetical protein
VVAATSSRPGRPNLWVLSTILLLTVLLFGHDLPTRADRVGTDVLVAKVRWTSAWIGLHWLALASEPSAETLLRLDPELRTAQAQEAARWLARFGSHQKRLRWAVVVMKREPNTLALLRLAVRDAITADQCDLLRAAVATARTLPTDSPARRSLADEFATSDALTHWGATSVAAGRKVAHTARLERAARSLRSGAVARGAKPVNGIRSRACLP